MRWPGTEGILFAVKRKLGENAASRSKNGMIEESYLGFLTYEGIREYGEKSVVKL